MTQTAHPRLSFSRSIEDFIGEGGTLDWPQAIVENKPGVGADVAIDGYESIGGLRFAPIDLAPGQSQSFVLILAILDGANHARRIDRALRQSRQIRSGVG